MELDGIKFVSGKKEILENAIRKVHEGELNKQEQNTPSYVKRLMEVDSIEEKDETKIEGIELLQNLIEKMKKLKISGNEFVMFFNDAFRRFGVLNEGLDRSFIGELTNTNNSKTYKRKIWLKEKQTGENDECSMYLIDTETLEISDVTELQMREKLKNGEFVYESKAHQMKNFEMEEK